LDKRNAGSLIPMGIELRFSQKSKSLLTVLKWTVSLIMLIWSLKQVPLSDLGNQVHGWKWHYFILLLIIAAFVTHLQALRWKLLWGKDAPDLKVFLRFSWIGYYYNLIVPFGIGGDILKSYQLGKKTSQKKKSLYTTMQMRMQGFLALFLLFLIANQHISGLSNLWIYAFAFPIFIFTLTPFWFHLLPKKVLEHRFFYNWGLNEKVHFWKEWVPGILFSILIQFTSGILHWLFYLIIGAPLSFLENLTYFPALILVVSLPLSILGLGVRESYSIHFIGSLDHISASQCIEASLIGYLLILIFAAIGLWVSLKD
jgi:glycosyltransferase 2 family protein